MATSDDHHDDSYQPLGDGEFLELDRSRVRLSDTYTGDDISRAYDNEREQQELYRQERKEETRPYFNLARIVVVGLSVLTIIGSFVYVLSTQGAYADQFDANQQRIGELELDDRDRDRSNETEPDINMVRNSLVTAHDKGQQLADLQNEYAQTALNPEDKTRNLDDFQKDVERISNSIKGLLGQGVDSGGEFNPAVQWFAPLYPRMKDDNDDGLMGMWVPLGTDFWEWEFVSTYDFDESLTAVPVVWQARIKTGPFEGELLGWVTAKFNPNTGVFSHMRRGLTLRGHELAMATPGSTGIANGEPLEDDIALIYAELGLIPLDSPLIKSDEVRSQAQKAIDRQQKMKIADDKAVIGMRGREREDESEEATPSKSASETPSEEPDKGGRTGVNPLAPKKDQAEPSDDKQPPAANADQPPAANNQPAEQPVEAPAQ